MFSTNWDLAVSQNYGLTFCLESGAAGLQWKEKVAELKHRSADKYRRACEKALNPEVKRLGNVEKAKKTS